MSSTLQSLLAQPGVTLALVSGAITLLNLGYTLRLADRLLRTRIAVHARLDVLDPSVRPLSPSESAERAYLTHLLEHLQ